MVVLLLLEFELFNCRKHATYLCMAACDLSFACQLSITNLYCLLSGPLDSIQLKTVQVSFGHSCLKIKRYTTIGTECSGHNDSWPQKAGQNV